MLRVMERKAILNEDILWGLEAELQKWDKDNPDAHFSLWRWFRFAVLSNICPYVVEEPFLDMWKECASNRTRRKEILLPRGGCKSFQLKGFAAFLLCDHQAHKWGPQVRVAIGGQTKPFATRTVKGVRRILETNAWIRQEFGDMRPEKAALDRWAEIAKAKGLSKPEWSMGAFRTMACVRAEIDSSVVMEEPSCWAQGMDQSTTGFHFDVFINDDPVGASSYNSPKKKEKARVTHSDVQSQIMDGLEVCLGTRWAVDDLHHTILTDYRKMYSVVYSNVWGGGTEYGRDDFTLDEETGIFHTEIPLEDFTFFYDAYGCVEEEVRQGFRHPPEVRRWKTLQFICDKLFMVPTGTWTKQYLNRAVDDDDLVFHDWMFKTIGADRIPPGLPHYILTDSASGKDKSSSLRVVAAVGFDANDCAYVRDLQAGFWGAEDYMMRVIDARDRYGAKKVLMEQVAWQDAFRTVGQLLCQRENRQPLKVEAIMGRSLTSKYERIEVLEPRLRSNKLVFEERIKELTFDGKSLWSEMLMQFKNCRDEETSRGLRLDIPDALADIDATTRDGVRICRKAKNSRASSIPSEAQLIAKEHRNARNERRAFQQPARTGRIRKPSGW
jgi:hypothetical protein